MIAALFAGSEGGERAGLVVKGPGRNDILTMGKEMGFEGSIASIQSYNMSTGGYLYPSSRRYGRKETLSVEKNTEECVFRDHHHQSKEMYGCKHVA